MTEEEKKKLASAAQAVQDKAEQRAKQATGWQKVLWIIVCVGAATAAYFLTSCTVRYTQSAAGDIEFISTVVEPKQHRK
ncbi:MAG: hypothetical protein E7031_01445 [Akkermansiaceae bacterium]|nr:hypothetical protein [Akkermansiaceae bacterium]